MSPDVRLVLIESDLREANRIRKALAQVQNTFFSVESVQRLASGLDRLDEGNVDAVLVDLSLPESNGLDAFFRLRERAPQIPIIILADSEDESLALQAVHEGAQDYLVKGKVPGEELARCVRYAMERHHSRQASAAVQPSRDARQGRVLTFLGAKGGVGTSTVVLNVACALAHMGHSVIAAELRSCFGTFSHQLRRFPQPPTDLENPEFWRSPFGFRVLFGPKISEEAEIPAETAGTVIRKLAGAAEFAVVDLPPHPSAASRAAIRSSDFVGLVTEREPTSLFCAQRWLERLQTWSPESPVGAVVLNRVPLSIPVPLPEIALQLCVPVVGVIPPAADACVIAQKTGTPLIMVQQESLVAGSLRDLAKRLTGTPLYLANCF